MCQIRDCVSAGSLRFRLRGLKSRAHLIQKYTYPIFVITFLASMWALFCNAFLIRLSDFRHGIILKFAGTVFSKSQLLKATDAMLWRHTAFVCGGNPCSEGLSSHVQFLVSVPNLQAGVTPTQNEWIEKPGSFNSKIHVSDQFDFQ